MNISLHFAESWFGEKDAALHLAGSVGNRDVSRR